MQVKSHIVDKTLLACVIQHCTWDSELERPVLLTVEVVAKVRMQKHRELTDLWQPVHFACFQKVVVNQVACYVGPPDE